MRWVFIRPANRSPYYDPEIQEPLGLEYLAADRRRHGDAVLLLDASFDTGDETKLGRRAASFEPDAIGFSITTAQEMQSVRAIYDASVAALRQRPVCWLAGGNFVSSEPGPARALLPECVHLIRFEGERALDDIAKEWREGGGAWHPATGGTLTGSLREGAYVENLDTLPFPERPYARQILNRGWALNIIGSRGCCGACRYCSSPGMYPTTSKRWRGRSPSHVAEELESLVRAHGARSFNFVDEDFLGPPTLAPRRAAEFASELARRQLNISFGIQVRPATLSLESIDALCSVGLTYVFMGIESDSPEDFKRWGRPFTPNPWPLVARLRERGADVNIGSLMFHSHSTLAGIRRFAFKLRENGLLEYRSARNRLDAMPGSFLFLKGIEEGRLDRNLCGPQPLPFVNPEVEPFYRDILDVLDPIGPPSMHAACALPPLLAGRRWSGETPVLRELYAILRLLDEGVAGSFFTLLDHHERRLSTAAIVRDLRQSNLEAALDASQRLEACGLGSYTELREAIRIDCGL
jgi:hypothetical protein